MKKNKTYIAISFWAILCLFLFYQYHLNSLVGSEEQKTISITNQKIRSLTQKLHQSKLKRVDIHINEDGNYKRDRKLYDEIKNAYSSVEELYENNTINVINLKSSLTDSTSVRFTTKSIAPAYNFKGVKDIYNTNLYQNAYNLLGEEYYQLYGFDCGFYKVMVLNASDTTLGLYSTRAFFSSAEIPKMTIKILSKEYPMVSAEGPIFDKNFKKPIIFQVNTHTKTGIIKKRYQIIPKKNQKLQPFDYKEILP
jgi:hypothetical protein